MPTIQGNVTPEESIVGVVNVSDVGTGGSGGNGADGFSPIATVTRTNDGADISITDKNGTTIATVYDGKDGQNAKIAVVNVEIIGEGDVPSATVSNTPAGAFITLKIPKGEHGENGSDYILTDADRIEIAELASDMVDVPDVDLTGYATEEYVRNKIAEAELGGEEIDLSGYAEKSDLPTKVSQLENDAGYLTQHQDISGKLNASELPNAINIALAQAKSSGEFDGADGVGGQRGHGILKVTTTPTSYTTTTGGKAPIKRMSLSTIKSEANVDEVLVGDQICHSYYLYNVYYLDATYAYMDKSQSIRGTTGSSGSAGKDGTSVTITSVVESEESGGENVVTFSDGKTLTVRNGKDGSGDSTPDYVVAEAKETAKKVLSHQSEDCFTLAWLSDLHIGSSYKINDVWITDDTSVIEAGQGLHEMSKTAPCDMLAIGGDLASGTIMTQHADGLEQLDTCMEYLRPVTFHTPTLYLVGNHDDVPYRATADRLSRAEMFSRFGKKNLLAGAVTNNLDKGCNYGYLDFDNRKMRIIYLDTHDKNGWESTNCVNGETADSAYMNACNVSAKQLHWLANTALDFSEKESPSNWGVIVLSHTQLDICTGNRTYTDATSGKTYTYNTDNVITILMAYLSKGAGSITLNGETATYDFSGMKEKAYLYGCINGHRHCYEYREYGSKKIPGITCPNTCAYGERENPDGSIYPKTLGTRESTTFGVITIDRKNGKIYADNHGAGIDREWDVVVYSAYKNLVPTATVVTDGQPPSTEIYNGVGYKNNTRISSISSLPSADGYVTTGVMIWRENPGAFSELKPIYIKGATLDTSKSYVRMLFITNIGTEGMKSSRTLQGGTTGNTGWETYFTIETLGDQYYKLTPIESAMNWNNVRYFMLSLYGSGENLIITVDEPID